MGLAQIFVGAVEQFSISHRHSLPQPFISCRSREHSLINFLRNNLYLRFCFPGNLKCNICKYLFPSFPYQQNPLFLSVSPRVKATCPHFPCSQSWPVARFSGCKQKLCTQQPESITKGKKYTCILYASSFCLLYGMFRALINTWYHENNKKSKSVQGKTLGQTCVHAGPHHYHHLNQQHFT